jgi:hypothetical protein
MTPRCPGRILVAVGDQETLLEEISALLAACPSDLEVIERTLTDGYAKALSLEAERWRLQKQLAVIAATLERGDVEEKSKELSELVKRLELQDGALTKLRELLTQLRTEYTEVTDAATAQAARSSRRSAL